MIHNIMEYMTYLTTYNVIEDLVHLFMFGLIISCATYLILSARDLFKRAAEIENE
jgi:hypothetical protein